MGKDKLFSGKRKKLADFDFGKNTAEVFDDMLPRSVPLYREVQRMIGEIANEFAAINSNVYDLGCSTGITLATLLGSVRDKKVKFIGVDYSKSMLEKCRKNLKKLNFANKVKIDCADLNNGYRIRNASVVILNLTLQFIRPLYRDSLIQQIYQGLNDNGCLIVVEKVLGNKSIFNRMFIKFYYEMKKRNGYTKMEISQKREALENILIPYRMGENEELLKRSGFKHIDIFYKWYNFYGLIAIKA